MFFDFRCKSIIYAAYQTKKEQDKNKTFSLRAIYTRNRGRITLLNTNDLHIKQRITAKYPLATYHQGVLYAS